RIQELFQAYYRFQVTSNRTPELMFCDFPSVFAVSYILHEVGLTLQLDPPRLAALLSAAGPELESVLFDSAPLIGLSRRTVMEYEEDLTYRGDLDEASDNTIWNIAEKVGEDLAGYASVYFHADVMIAFLMTAGSTEDERRREQKALERLVLWSTKKTLRAAFGDTLADALRPIYWDQNLLTKFCRAGGISALMLDCSTSACNSIAKKAVGTLPAAAWETHDATSLLTTTQSLAQLKKLDESWKPLDLLILGCHNIYRNYGIAPFIKASEVMNWEDPMFFSYLARQLQQRGLPQQTEIEIRALYDEFDNAPLDIKIRCRWFALDASGRWDFIELYGCDNEECRERAEFLRLRRIESSHDQKTETKLYEWGLATISCEACHAANYCSTNCREAALLSHAGPCARAQEGPAQPEDQAQEQDDDGWEDLPDDFDIEAEEFEVQV
ncbi:hypothetical protein SISNIDRAFT_458610, partial [Sistotremastrum niveocremeum HHB9708]